jgi:hypothetical protein
MRTSVVLPGLMLIAVMVACGDESDNPVVPPAPTFQALTVRSAVLNNLEVAYNQRNIVQFEKLLDVDFTFYLSGIDVNEGLPAQWDRSVEISANTNLFSRDEDPQGRWPLCTSIQMNVIFDDTLTWIEVPGPGETWYTTTLFYEFQIAVEPDTNFLPVPGAKAEFTVRNAGTDDAPQWQLLEWHDIGAGTLFALRGSETEETTWGGVKSLYRGDQ